MTQVAVEPHKRIEVGSQSTTSTAVVAARPWLPAALAGVSGAVVIGLLLLLWFGIEQRDKGTVGEASVPLRQAPDFTLGLFDGGTFRLADKLHQGQGRPVLVNFWTSWCVPCAEEAPVLETAASFESGMARSRPRLSSATWTKCSALAAPEIPRLLVGLLGESKTLSVMCAGL